MLPARRPGAFGGLLPIILALLLAPSGTLLCVERAVVIGVDLVEALPLEIEFGKPEPGFDFYR